MSTRYLDYDGLTSLVGLIGDQIDDAVDSAVAGVYTVKGSCAFADLPTDAEAGDVWNVTDAFTTTDSFVEGEGVEYGAGTNVVYTDSGWDVLAGLVDLSAYATTDEVTEAIESAGHLTEDEVTALIEEYEYLTSVGGTNILRNTNADVELLGSSETASWSNGQWRASSSSSYTIDVAEVSSSSRTPNPDVDYRFRLDLPEGVSSGSAYFYQDEVPLVAGETYTLSCYAYGIDGGSVMLTCGQSSKTTSSYVSNSTTSLASTDGWVKVSSTFEVLSGFLSSGTATVGVYLSTIIDEGGVYVAGLKLEVGEAATDWSPSPWDVEQTASDAAAAIDLSGYPTSDTTVGSGVNPVYVADGAVAASAETVGGASEPVYLKAGTVTTTGYDLSTFATSDEVTEAVASIDLSDYVQASDLVAVTSDEISALFA